MNQERNKNEQNNGIPNIFSAPVDIHSFSGIPDMKPQPQSPVATENLLMNSIPVFDIPNFDEIKEVENVLPVEPIEQKQVVTEPQVMEEVPTINSPSIEQPSIVDEAPNVVEETPVETLNPWVALVESKKESHVVTPPDEIEKKSPVVVKPQTFEDLISSPVSEEVPVVATKKKSPRNFIFAVIGIIAIIIIIVIAVAVLNKAGNKTLSCTLTEEDSEFKYETTDIFKFKGKELVMLGTKNYHGITNPENYKEVLGTLKGAMTYELEELEKHSGVKTKMETGDNFLTYEIMLEKSKVKIEEWEKDELNMYQVPVLEYIDKDYNTLKKEYTESGYTCK